MSKEQATVLAASSSKKTTEPMIFNAPSIFKSATLSSLPPVPSPVPVPAPTLEKDTASIATKGITPKLHHADEATVSIGAAIVPPSQIEATQSYSRIARPTVGELPETPAGPHRSHTLLHESHFCTYTTEEVIAAGGKYDCAECGSTVRALKLDADEAGGIDFYCEPCWFEHYGEKFTPASPPTLAPAPSPASSP
jgi:hypothetical protein